MKHLGYTSIFIAFSLGLSHGIEDLIPSFPIPTSLQTIIEHPLIEENLLSNIQKIQTCNDINTKWGNQIVFGWMAFQRNNYVESIQQWEKALNFNLTEKLNQLLLKYLCQCYEKTQSKALFLTYEKYVETCPQALDAPTVHLNLGFFYLKSKIFERASYHFYTILSNIAMVSNEKFSACETYITGAQLGIAYAFFQQKKYNEALDYFSKIHLQNAEPEFAQIFHFAKGICAYYAYQFPTTIESLKQVCESDIDVKEKPEAFYYLIHSYQQQHDKENTLNQIFNFLKISQEKRTEQAPHWENWDYYQKKAARDIAEKFYKNEQIIDALKLYQILVDMELTPVWQWPILCKIGLCYGRLNLTLKSKAAYEIIVQGIEKAKEKDSNEAFLWNKSCVKWTDELRDYYQLAQWHLEQIATYESIKLRMEILTQKQS